MPAGLPYFAWVDASETVFGFEHMRWDESVFSFTLAQEEGDPASLTAIVRRPRNLAGDAVGLLCPSRKIWVWFALDCGPSLIKFRGRLVGIPTSLFEDLVTLEFVARPADVVAQKEALANTLRVLPFYDPVMIDEARRTDPEVVLEGYTKIWHFDRETHAVTVSDEITGEDGLVEFDGESEGGKVLWDGLGLTLTSGPLSRVDINAEFNWTQQAGGTVDLTNYLISHWPDQVNGEIPKLNAGDWPKHGGSLGDGWEVADASAKDMSDLSTHTESLSGSTTLGGDDDDATTTVQWSSTTTQTNARYTTSYGSIVTDDSYSVQHDIGDTGSFSGSRTFSETFTLVAAQAIRATLVAGYKAARPYSERVSLTMFADVQPILTDPEDGEALRIDDIRSVNLSEVLDGETPIGDPGRRSYIATERGNQSVEYLIALARTHLMKRARAVEITFAPKLARMSEITLRKNAFLIEPRVGEALGKIIGYSVALNGSDGRINCEVRIGCAIGRGGSAVGAGGTPTYCSIDYVGADYQQFTGRFVLFDTSVGYQPPNADPNDDGIDFLSALTADDVIEVGLVVEHGPDPDETVEPPTNNRNPAGSSNDDVQNMTEARNEYIKNHVLPAYETRARFKLKSMTREFSTDYQIQVTDLKIPTGYNLEVC